MDSGVHWCTTTQTLSGWIEVKGERRHVRIPRKMIHNELYIYNDAIEWEIERFKHDIFDRLTSSGAPLLLKDTRGSREAQQPEESTR